MYRCSNADMIWEKKHGLGSIVIMRKALCEGGSEHEFLPLLSTSVSIYNLFKIACEIFKNIRLNILVKHSAFQMSSSRTLNK